MIITENVSDTQKILENFLDITENVSDYKTWRSVHPTEVLDWQNIHWLNMRLSSLGIIGTRLKTPLKLLNTKVF